jgi:hypothetical protein
MVSPENRLLVMVNLLVSATNSAWNLILALIVVNRLIFRTQKAELFFRLSTWASKWCLLALPDKEEQSCEVQWFLESLISC